MNRDAIRATAVCYWSDEDESYVAISPLFETIAGVGDTEAQAMEIFNNQLQDAYEAYLEGRIPKDRRGRPSKNQVALNVDVNPETKEGLKELAAKIGCSQGEVIDFLFTHYDRLESEEHKKHLAGSGGVLDLDLVTQMESTVLESMQGFKDRIRKALESKNFSGDISLPSQAK